jgi:hypothetical protein
MRKTLIALVILVAALLIVYVALAAQPVARISSSESFTVAGTKVPIEGVPSWPVVAGDEVVVGNATAVVTFADGSRVRLGTKARAKLEGSAQNPALRLVDGVMAYTFSRKPSLQLFAAANAVTGTTRGTAFAGSGTETQAAALRGLGLLKAGDKKDDKDKKDGKNPPPVSDKKKE